MQQVRAVQKLKLRQVLPEVSAGISNIVRKRGLSVTDGPVRMADWIRRAGWEQPAHGGSSGEVMGQQGIAQMVETLRAQLAYFTLVHTTPSVVRVSMAVANTIAKNQAGEKSVYLVYTSTFAAHH